jgi:hypothetical protein
MGMRSLINGVPYLFACAPSQGPEFYNNMEASNNAFGAEDSKAWM